MLGSQPVRDPNDSTSIPIKTSSHFELAEGEGDVKSFWMITVTFAEISGWKTAGHLTEEDKGDYLSTVLWIGLEMMSSSLGAAYVYSQVKLDA